MKTMILSLSLGLMLSLAACSHGGHHGHHGGDHKSCCKEADGKTAEGKHENCTDECKMEKK